MDHWSFVRLVIGGVVIVDVAQGDVGTHAKPGGMSQSSITVSLGIFMMNGVLSGYFALDVR